jgi:3-hydroxyacyl-[acyl-carrier-protein] dehydratase
LINIEQIMEYLPHRYPMLLVDRILEVEPGKCCTGLKNVTMNEAFFQGHYPGMPIMPGVLIVEAMAQAGAIVILSDVKNKGLVPLIGAINDVKFTKAELVWFRNGVGRMKSVATVDGEVAASMELTFKVIQRSQ